MSKQSVGIAKEILNLCDEIQSTSNSSLILSFAKRLLHIHRKNIIVDIDFGNDGVLAGLMYLLSHAKNSNTHAPINAPTRLLIIAHEHIPFIRAFLKGLDPLKEGVFYPVVLGTTDDVKDDLSLLHGNSSLIISTPKRMIDHLRRGNLSLMRVRQACIIEPPQGTDPTYFDSFDNDLLYLNAKLSRKAKRILLSQDLTNLPSFVAMLPRYKILSDADLVTRNEVFLYRVAEITPQVISDYIYAQRIPQVLIIAAYPKIYEELDTYFSSNRELYTVTIKHLSESATIPSDGEHIIYAGLPLEDKRIKKMSSINPVVAGTHHIVYTARDTPSVLPIQENYTMSKRFETPEAQEVLEGKIKLLIEAVEKDANPDELNNLKRVIKKHVPFYRRGYLTAFLFRAYMNSDAPRGSRQRTRKAAPVFSDEDSSTLFFGVGRSRRTYPKDITKLIVTEAGVSEEGILAIKSLENYSFVTVKKDVAETIIEKLHGLKYKGRALVVNHAKSKK